MSIAEEIRRTVSVPTALEALGVELPDRIPGLICCPVHDDNTPSLNVDETVWYCHGCGVGGGCIDAVMFIGGVGFEQACKYLAGSVDELNEMPAVERKERVLGDFTEMYEKVKPAFRTMHEYDQFDLWLEEKWPGNPRMLDLLALGWAKVGEHNLWIPHYDSAGVVRGIKLRVMTRPNVGKKNGIQGSCLTSRLYRVIDRPFAPLAFLVEGETDTWTLSMYFLDRQDVAVYGMPSGVLTWRQTFADELNEHGAVIVAFDADKAGRDGLVKAGRLLDHFVPQLLPAGVNDVTEAFAVGWRPLGGGAF